MTMGEINKLIMETFNQINEPVKTKVRDESKIIKERQLGNQHLKCLLLLLI